MLDKKGLVAALRYWNDHNSCCKDSERLEGAIKAYLEQSNKHTSFCKHNWYLPNGECPYCAEQKGITTQNPEYFAASNGNIAVACSGGDLPTRHSSDIIMPQGGLSSTGCTITDEIRPPGNGSATQNL